MSYEIVKNLKVKQDLDGSFVAVINCASNNVYPRHYVNFEYGKNKGWTKEQLEKELLLDFYHGNLQGGSSKYRKIGGLAYTMGYLKKYNRIDSLINKVNNRYWKAQGERKAELNNLATKLYKLRDAEGKNALYRCMCDKPKKIKFTIKDRWGSYVIKVNKCTYRRGSNPRVFDSAELYNLVTTSEWWKENFIVEIVK